MRSISFPEDRFHGFLGTLFRGAITLVALALLGGMLLGPIAASAQQPAAPPVTTPIVFDEVTVIDVEHGKHLPAQRVVIVGNRITAMGKTGKIRIPKGARVVDAKGKYLIPGLWDMHTHSRLYTEFFYPLFIAHGVTGIRDGWSEVPLDTLVQWRREILAGTRVGPPRQLLPGPALNQCQRARGPGQGHICITDSADARHVVDSLKAAGADYLKTYQIGRELYFVVAAEARRVGLPFGGHLTAVNASDASDSGAALFDHTNSSGGVGPRCIGNVTVEQCQPIAEQFVRTGAWFVPTLVRLQRERVWAQPATGVILARLNTHVREFWAGSPRSENWLLNSVPVGPAAGAAVSEFSDSLGSLRVAVDVDLPILAGTDAGAPVMQDMPPGFALHAELAMYQAEGMTSLEALQTATLNPAKFLRATDSLGTVAPGKLADLVLLDADPLADITNTTMIRAVVANGRYYDRAALDQLLTEVQAKATTEPAPLGLARSQPTRVFTGPLPFDTAQVVVTAEDFAQLLAFLQATVNEWRQPAMQRLMQRYMLQYPMALGNVGDDVPVPPQFRAGVAVPIPNYALIADSVPAVAQALASAKLTGVRYLQLSRTLNAATVTDQLDRLAHGGTPSVTDTSTVIGKNVVFLRAHQTEFAKLVALGLDVMILSPSRP